MLCSCVLFSCILACVRTRSGVDGFNPCIYLTCAPDPRHDTFTTDLRLHSETPNRFPPSRTQFAIKCLPNMLLRTRSPSLTVSPPLPSPSRRGRSSNGSELETQRTACEWHPWDGKRLLNKANHSHRHRTIISCMLKY